MSAVGSDRELNHADTARAQHVDKLCENSFAVPHRHMLKHKHRVDEIKLPEPAQIAGRHKLHPGQGKRIAVAARLAEHRRRDVDPNRLSGLPRERNKHSAHAAPEIKNPLRLEGRINPASYAAQQFVDVLPTRRKETFAHFRSKLTPAKLVVCVDAVVRIGAGETLPLVGWTRAHPPARAWL